MLKQLQITVDHWRMPSALLQRVCRASVLLSATVLLVLPAVTQAMSFSQIERTFPALANELSGDPVLPAAIDTADDGIANADATTDGSGLFVVSPQGSLRDEDGTLIDPAPRLVPSASGPRAVTGGGLADVRFPSGRDPWLELGDGVRVRLVGRRSPKFLARAGAVLYPGALPGVDQLFLLDPDTASVEELLVVNSRTRLTSAAYVVSLPRGWQLSQKTRDGETILVVRDASSKSRVEISAPTALDGAGVRHRVELRRTSAAGFTVTVRPARGVRIRGALAIDPLYAKTNNTAYPLGDGGRPYYTGEVCGNLAEFETDYPSYKAGDDWRTGNPWLENGAPGGIANEFNPCSVPNEGPLVTFSDNTGPDDAFAQSRGIGAVNQGRGVTVAVRSGKAAKAGTLAWARMNAPDNVGVWESDFRGHTGEYGALADPDTRCELRVGPRRLGGQLSEVPTALVATYWGNPANEPSGRPAATNNNVFFFGGYPYGSDGGGAWAQFPFPDHPSAGIGAGYRYSDEVPFDADSNTHMFGRFSMDADKPTAQDLWNMPRWVEMRLVVRKDVTGGDRRCSADGRWRVVYRDAVDPIAAPPAIPAGWHADTEVDEANVTRNHVWRQVAASDVEGSGVKQVESIITRAANADGSVFSPGGDPQLGEKVCATGSSGTQETIISIAAQPCPTADVWRINNSFNVPSDPAAAFQAQAGPHRYQWVATDFAGREGRSAVTPVQTAPSAGNVGWYWVDANPPSCTISTPYIVAGMANVSVTGTETVYASSGIGIRRGSGIARIRVYKVARDAPFDYNNPSGAVVVDQSYPLDDMRGGDRSEQVFAQIPLSIAEQEGDFRLVAIVNDGVNKRSLEQCSTPPTDCTGATLGTLNLYRGASGVLARWTNPTIVPPGSAGRVETTWMATITKPDGSVEVRSGVILGGEHIGRDGEVFIDAPPASQVDMRIDAQCTSYRGQPQRTSTLTGTEFVDARPDVVIGTPFTAVDTRPGASKFRADGTFDPVYERLHVAVTDPNGFTQQRSGANYAQAGSIQRTLNADASSDRARVIVRLTPDRASSRATDADPATPGAETYLVWEIGAAATGTPHRYWLVDGPLAADAYTRSFAALDPAATCTAGGGRIDTAFWSLNCATSVPTVSAGAAGDRGTRGFEVDLDLIPRDNNAAPLAGTPERFPTPDRNYNVDAAVRDQRQEADQRFLHQDASAAANAQISRADAAGVGSDAPPGFDRIGALIVDREQPTADFTVEARPGDQSVTIANVLHVRLGYVLAANDARDVDPAVGDASPSRVSWTGFGQVWFEQPPAPPGFTMLMSGGAAPCDQALPRFNVAPGSGTRCARTYTSALPIYAVGDDDQRLLAVRAHVVDVARNERVFTDDVYVDRVDPIVAPVAIKGASGVAAAWPMPVDMSPPIAHQWRCDAPGPAAADPDAAVPDPGWQAAFAAERAGWTSSGICPGLPGQNVAVWIRVTDAVGNITVASVNRNVDERPELVDITGDSDPQIYNDAWDDPKWDPTTDPRDRRNDTIELTVRDRDDIVGVASVNDDRVADAVAITQPVTAGDRGIFVLRVDDPRSTTEGWLVIQARSSDGDGSYENAAAAPTLVGATAWLTDDPSLVSATAAVPIAGQGCQLGEATTLATDWWEFDCSRFEATIAADAAVDPYGTTLELNLPLRARANTTQATPFVTPDDVYDLSAWVRDQRQLADHGYLTQIVAGAGAAPGPNATFGTPRTWLGLGRLRTDRIEPVGILTRTGQSTPVDRYDATVVDGQPVHLDVDVLASDITPGAAAAGDLDVIAGDIAIGAGRNTMTRFASGLDHVGVTAVRVTGLATLASWSSACPGTGTQLLLAGDARNRCTLDIDLGFLAGRAYVEADILVVDQAGNFKTITRRFPVDPDHIDPGGACGATNGFAPLVDIPQGNDLQAITSNNVSRLDGSIATQNPMTFETKFSNAGQSGFGSGIHCGRMEWSGTVELRPTAGSPWTPARPGGLDVAEITTFQNQPFRGDFGPGPDLGERFLTYRAHVALDGSPLPAPGNPPTAITRRVMIAEATLANGQTRSAFIEIISRMPAVSNGAAQPARLEVKMWVGPTATTRRPIWQAPDVSFGVDITAKCMHGCENTPLLPF